MQEVAEQEIDKMLQQGAIEPSNSPWAAPIVLCSTKDNSIRFCVDYRKINQVSRKDAYPLSRIEKSLDSKDFLVRNYFAPWTFVVDTGR